MTLWPANGTGHGSANTSQSLKRAELASAYNALATELTQHEIKSIGPYSLGRVIGQGSFGKVRLGVHRLTNTRVAIKQVPKSLPGSLGSGDRSSPLSLLTREIHHHRRLRHAHVLALYEIIATETNIYLVSELCTGGELFDYLIEKERLSTSEVRRIGGQLILGLHYLHARGVVHRDLKLENVLLDEHINVKIADLGFGREFERGKLMDTWVGTLGYCAPEIVAATKYYGEAVDIWSLGVILYALLVGSLPFDDDDEAVMKQAILTASFDVPQWLDDDSANMLRSILVVDPLQRPSLVSILDMPFFTRSSPPTAPPGFPSSPTTTSMVMPITEEDESIPPLLARASSESSDSERRPFVPRTTSAASSTTTRRKDSSSYLGPPPVHSPSLQQGTFASPGAPPMSRNMSASSAVSLSSMRSHVTSPAHNTRTPSRTKRRSISSILSERATLQPDQPDDEWVDWRLRLLEDVQTGSTASFAQNAHERDLLHRLASLGFDEGQIRHSVTTDACDSVAATWWILADKRKREEKQLRRKESRESNRIPDMTILGDNDVFATDLAPRSWEPPPSSVSTSQRESLDEPSSAGRPKLSVTTTATPSSYFVLPTSASAPSLSQYGSSVPSSPSKGNAFYDHDRTPMAMTLNLPASGSVPEISMLSAAGALDSPTAAKTPTATEVDFDSVTRRRTRSGSQSVLARASAALGSSLGRAKSSEENSVPLGYDSSALNANSNVNANPNRLSASQILTSGTANDGKLSPSMQLATLFGRKSFVDKATPSNEPPQLSPLRQSVSLPRSADPRVDPRVDPRADARVEAGAEARTDAKSDEAAAESPALTASPVPSSSTANTTTVSKADSHAQPTRTTTGRKNAKTGLFSNFRQWFAVDAQKKQQRKRNTIDPASIGRSYRSSPQASTRAPMQKRPPSSRRSSTGSAPNFAYSAPSVSRNSSVASSHGHRVSGVSPAIGPRRRPSDSSVPSLSDRETSRPSSARSDRIVEPSAVLDTPARHRQQHYKTGSFSSTTTSGSRPGLASHSPKDVFRRPPTVTTVRRMHASSSGSGHHHHHHHPHRRGHSGSSTTRSSSSSAGEDEMSPLHAHDHAVLEDVDEEDGESVKNVERSKALSKLSGDLSSLATPAPPLQRLHSRESELSSSSSRPHSPIIFSAHRSHHVFGAPSQASATKRPPLRDVFSSKRSRSSTANTDADWIDEDDDDETEDELQSYSGGVGQGALSRSLSRTRQSDDAGAQNQAQKGSPVPPPLVAQESWRSHMPASATFKKAIPIAEEEEEE